MSHNIINAMDLLKSCNTGVQTLGNLEAIGYQVCAIEKKEDAEDIGQGEAIVAGIATLRAWSYFAYLDTARRVVWIFHGGSLTSGFATRPDISKIAADWPFQLKLLYKGSFKASELSHCLTRPPPPASNTIPEPCIPISNVSPAVRHGQLMLHKSLKASPAPPGSAQEPGVTPIHIQAIYNKFISAIYSTISYNLSRHHRWIEVNAFTFVHLPEGWETGSDTIKAAPLQCFSLDIYLASGGQLVISTDTVDHHIFFPHQDSDSSMALLDPILLAPGGMLAVVDDDSVAPENAASQAWKEIVSNLLASKGIQINALDPASRWILVRAWPSTTAADSDTTLGTVFYWPHALCFRTSLASPSSPRLDSIHDRDGGNPDPRKLTPSSWFYSAKEGGFLDSLQFAEDWFKAKMERDKIVHERQRKRKEAEAAAQKQAEPATSTVASPFYTRGDLQAVGGVYPTPPDGIVSQPATVPAAPDTIPATAAHDAPLPRTSIGDMMDLDDMGAFGEGAKRRSTVESRNSMQMDVNMGDDLFGNIDEDEFGGHDITDADFSFFDEPDGDDDIVGPTSSAPDARPETDLQVDGQQVSSAAEIPSSDPAPQLMTQEATGPSEEVPEEQDPDVELIQETPRERLTIATSDAIVMKSPLSPTSVRKKLFEEMSNGRTLPRRRESQYEAVPFKPSLISSDTKYSSGGAFGFAEIEISNAAKRPVSKVSKTVDIRLHPRKRPRTERQQPRPRDSDESSYTSDASDDDSLSEFEALSLVPSPVKGMFFDKRIVALQDGDATSVATSPGSYMAIDDNPASGMSGSVQDRIELLDAILKPPSSRIPPSALIRLSNDSDGMLMLNPTLTSAGAMTLAANANINGPLSPTHKDFILISQIIAEQIIFGSFDLSRDTTTEDGIESDTVAVKSHAITPIRAAQAALKSFHSGLVDCDLLKFLCISDHLPEKPQGAKGQPQLPAKKVTAQASDGSVVSANVVATLPPPHVRVRRNEGLWDILPPALPFWEHLGLAPASGRKNLMAFCIYPGGDDAKSQVSLFMEYLGASYESCKLGAHIRSNEKKSTPLNIDDGLISVTLTEQDDPFETTVLRLREVCVEVGKHLSTVNWQRKKSATATGEELPPIDNFIIYLINPFDNGRGVAELCAAFWMLYKAYGTASRSHQPAGPRPDLVLQIIPVADVASPTAPVIHESIYFQKLARQIYDRCPPSSSFADQDPSRLRISSAASIQLEQSFPKKIMFQLTSEPPSDLLHDNSHLHVAYAVSKNGEWVTAAWTCSTGRYQASVSYCLVGGRTFFEVAREIWNATMEIMQARRVAWRLCVVKAGLMGREELDAWSSLYTAPSLTTVIICIMSIDPHPPVSVFPSPPPTATIAQTLIQESKGTPVSTPQPGISPDPHSLTPASTPSASVDPTATDLISDPDAHLVDIGDETYGLVLGHRVNVLAANNASQSGSGPREYRPSLSSGYLFKTNTVGGTPLDCAEGREVKGVVLVGVHLVWVGTSPRPNQQNQQQSQQQAQATAGSSPFSPIDASAPPTPGSAAAPQNVAPTGSQNMGTSIPRTTADSILREYLGLFRNLGTLARARGIGGTLRGALPWHAVVALRGVQGLEETFGNLNEGSD